MTLLINLKKVADPYRSFYPKNTANDCVARSIRDMRIFKDAIYIGCSDYGANAGPILVISFTKDCNTISLRPEYVVDEETIEVFRVYDNNLYVPGIDPRQVGKFGNYYFKKSNRWYKRRTIPKAIHVLDIAVFDNEISTLIRSSGIGIARKSSDNGKTWKPITQGSANQNFGTSLIPINDKLLIVGRSHFFVYKNGNFKKYNLKEPIVESRRIEYFNGGALSIPVLLYRLGQIDSFFENQVPLFFMNNFNEGPKHIPAFNKVGVFVRDIFIQNNKCYVMAVNDESEEGYKTVIKTSGDLSTWKRIANFTVPALPYSFELLNGEFYVGLGNRTGRADSESGTIWRIF